MFIQDLNHVEMISEDIHLEGGALSMVSTGAFATGSKLALTYSSGQASAENSFGYYYYGYGANYAQGSGVSSAFALGRGSVALSSVDVVAIA